MYLVPNNKMAISFAIYSTSFRYKGRIQTLMSFKRKVKLIYGDTHSV